MATPAQPIVFQVSTYTLCAPPAKILDRGGYFEVPEMRAVVSYALLWIQS
jgi:hypothetical protein